MTKTPNDQRRERNAVLRAQQAAIRDAERAIEMARWRKEHRDDCTCTLCECFGQGTCAQAKNLTVEEYEDLWMQT